MPKFDEYEKEIIKSYENDEWQSVEDLETEKVKYAKYARNTFTKSKRINIRISERDLIGLKIKSLEEGIPYQTLVSSILHKYISGRLVDR
ncbi:antitoxin [candidate division KSB1 bacterium]|nr:antitoxin [candidate division KSB1 bacterium]